ncbi:MAG: His/Gly/Thr/Pro-type tRNA ligase C-terminal domain-containing protein [Candidatus Berkelbacteria bacterium]|nr:His/Gly/Thr/Pro-type tRNA ligase C-terminal domain-containing protein [Candidatus Berkelbacteria bacterium]
MKATKFFLKTEKEIPADADSINASFLIRAGYIQKTMAGVYSYLPLGLKIIRKIEDIVRQEMNKIGGQEILMPVLAPKENWQKTGRFESLDILYKLQTADKKDLVLNPTHEEVIVPLVKSMITSYKNLPLYLYQIQDKFRNEPRAKSGLLRGREFLMKDMYSFHLTQEDLDDYYEKVSDAYKKIFSRLGIGDKTVLTHAAGGSFSKYSHEFQTISETGEDTIFLCDKCQVAINKEIIVEQNNCPKCGNEKLVEKKAIEVGNIFKLGTKYSAPFDFRVSDAGGKLVEIIMGCYGLGITRTFGAITEVFFDQEKSKIIWPESVAPFAIEIISLNKNEEAEKVYESLRARSIDSGRGNPEDEVFYDDRDISAGEKFADADLIGAPIRIIISEKSLTAGGVEISRNSKTEIVELAKVADLL